MADAAWVATRPDYVDRRGLGGLDELRIRTMKAGPLTMEVAVPINDSIKWSRRGSWAHVERPGSKPGTKDVAEVDIDCEFTDLDQATAAALQEVGARLQELGWSTGD